MALDKLSEKYAAFGWDVAEINGNDVAALREYFHSDRPQGKPHMLIARTVKGKGLPFAENKAEWHHKVPTEDQLKEAYEALGVKEVLF
jgi:transketolase